jgi:hypothetical protein
MTADQAIARRHLELEAMRMDIRDDIAAFRVAQAAGEYSDLAKRNLIARIEQRLRG